MNPIGWFTTVSSSSPCKPRRVHTTRERLAPKSESSMLNCAKLARIRLVNPVSFRSSPRHSELMGSGVHLALRAKKKKYIYMFMSFFLNRLTTDLPRCTHGSDGIFTERCEMQLIGPDKIAKWGIAWEKVHFPYHGGGHRLQKLN